jgi:hypothetical protein
MLDKNVVVTLPFISLPCFHIFREISQRSFLVIHFLNEGILPNSDAFENDYHLRCRIGKNGGSKPPSQPGFGLYYI